ncbi:hypothetical protein [Caballeronia zhejiangensis]|uniref:hypothetical protein n=2 Tax=Caballeronia zhejiangensis TaxID=871203 RepID=UPI001F51AF11|nr:hypothetical protein [Caballeronia zhejiangensis]MCI1047434.1 hypothetical protein [Caballeronia zhejiangensis]
MVRTVELIERKYEAARAAGRLSSEWGEMPFLDSEKLVVVPKDRLALYIARLQEVENELCRRTVDETFELMDAQGVRFLTPAYLEEEETSQGGKPLRARRIRRTRAPKSSFLNMFRNMFAKRTKQAG